MSEANHVDPRISKFVLPIGATVNMDGTALFVTVASIFIAQINGMTLNAGDLVTVVLTATATSVAAASVPSAALVLMLIVLSAIDAPYQDVSLLWAVDWFVDRCRTTNNMLGDCYGAAVVEALSKKELIAMDKAAEDEKNKELEGDIESGHETIVKKVKKGVSEERISNASSASLNGSSVEVPAVIIVDDSEREEDVEDQKM
jgi:Na+/H+-dicarboxylate symporter